MRSIHTTRWVSQLKGAGHDVHWFDILNGGYIKEWNWVTQHSNWRYRFGDFRGRIFLKKNLPAIHRLFEKNVEIEFERIIKDIQPDVVHSFVMYKCCVPIFPVMQRYPSIKWIYSSWGSDLYHFRNIPKHRKELENILPHIDYLFTDNKRDFSIAKQLGFQATFLGAFPGGGGFHIKELEAFVSPFSTRKTILIKGYQGRSGRAITVMKALSEIMDQLSDYEVVVFAADAELITYLEGVKTLDTLVVKSRMGRADVLKMMGEAYIYIGNSESDGMPNTLLEAIIMGAFPIQSNPGGVTEEIIINRKNGLLISVAEDKEDVKNRILEAVLNRDMLLDAFSYNQELKGTLEFDLIRTNVLMAYDQVKKELKK